MAVHMLIKKFLIKTASDLTAETVNTHVSTAAFPRICWKKLILILMSQATILFDKTAHVTGEILMMSFE